MYQELGNTEFEFIAINVDENTEDGIFFLEDHPVSYPVLADPEGVIGIPYRVRSLPVSYLLDREGRIVQSFRSYQPGDEIDIKQQIEILLAN
jgi:peroxiredoxin